MCTLEDGLEMVRGFAFAFHVPCLCLVRSNNENQLPHGSANSAAGLGRKIIP